MKNGFLNMIFVLSMDIPFGNHVILFYAIFLVCIQKCFPQLLGVWGSLILSIYFVSFHSWTKSIMLNFYFILLPCNFVKINSLGNLGILLNNAPFSNTYNIAPLIGLAQCFILCSFWIARNGSWIDYFDS
jgi:hypothetical protein